MMGHTHALSGAAAWLALAPVFTDHALLGQYAIGLSPAQLAAGAVVCAGAAMLPDMDHHDGTIANTFGIVSRWMCRGVAFVSGGHRHATHSLLFAAGAGFGSYWLAEHAQKAWWVVLFLLIGLGIRGIGIGLKERDDVTGLLNAAIAAGLVYVMRDLDMTFAGYAVALGCLAHVVGDCLTPEGCPVFWPIPQRLGVPVVPRTNGHVERWVLTPVLTLGVIVLAVRSTLGDSATHWLKT
jgi:membrane-bound metal-dependent hydrolase YbcI (DUF457 family)